MALRLSIGYWPLLVERPSYNVDDANEIPMNAPFQPNHANGGTFPINIVSIYNRQIRSYLFINYIINIYTSCF